MKTEAKFSSTLKEMMENTPLDSINITALCDKIGVKRQTFYYHYRDIYDLLTAIFLNEKIEGLSKASNWHEIISACLGYIRLNKVFLEAVANSSAADLIKGFLADQIFQVYFKNMNENPNYAILGREEIKNHVSVVSTFMSYIIEKYVIDTKKISAGQIEKKIISIYGDVPDTILERALRFKKKEA